MICVILYNTKDKNNCSLNIHVINMSDFLIKYLLYKLVNLG